MTTSEIALGADDAGLPLKEIIRQYLEEQGIPYRDYTPVSFEGIDYPDVAVTVAHAVARGEHTRGILFCGTGIGMAITANKVPGVYAAQAHDTYSAERARKSNNAQILTMGARVVGPELAKSIVRAWLNSEFSGGPSAGKVAKIEHIEKVEKAG
ncbi:MAG: ribose 5-phosphate isomerase B [Ktedonobacteraceae bacterium]|nr:ribose 5-phosphate isomerase B [Ktedonobacteraceae bacterium]